MPLSFIESRRVAVVIEDAIEKLTFLESISPDVLQHRDELSKFVGDEISRIISVQRQLEQRYECLIAQREGLKGSTNRSKYKNIQSEIQEVSRALRDSTKDLCRNLKDSPDIAGNLIKIQQERLNLIESLRTTLSEVVEKGLFIDLKCKLSEDKANQDRFNAIIERDRELSMAARQYDHNLELERVEHQKQVQEKQHAIKYLKHQLQSVRTKTSTDAKYYRKESQARACSVARSYRQAEQTQKVKVSKLNESRQTEESAHEVALDFLKQKQQQLVRDLSRWENKYASDYRRLESEFERLKQERLANLEQLKALQRRHNSELEAERALQEITLRQGELDRCHLAETHKKQGSAILVQNTVRLFLQRKAEEEARRAADKKNKKAGKKK